MDYETAKLALNNLSGGTFVGMDTLTTVTLTGGKKNPMQGRITKKTAGSQVMCFSNTNGSAYNSMVERRLISEGKNPSSFVIGPRPWGERVPNTAFVEHKGKYYLEVIFMRAGQTEYFLDGNPIAKNLIEGLPVSNEGDQGGLDDKVIIRSYALESIIALRANGAEWK